MGQLSYIDRNNEEWSIEKGDWLGFQYEEDKILKTKEKKKKIFFVLLLLPILVLLTTITL
jgi:hypothetical protein